MAFDTLDTDAVLAATTSNTFTNGGLTVQSTAASGLGNTALAQATEGKKSGKWYVEFTAVVSSGSHDQVGIVDSRSVEGGNFLGGAGAFSSEQGWGYVGDQGRIYNLGSSTTVATWGSGDVIGIAIDLDNKSLWFRVNTGAWIGTGGTPDPATNADGFDITTALANNLRVYPAIGLAGATAIYTANFGATSLTGTVPTGFTAGWTNTGTASAYFGTLAGTGFSGSEDAQLQDGFEFVSAWTSTLSGQLQKVVYTIFQASATTLKACIYAADGPSSGPGTLLGTSTNSLTPTSYVEFSFTFSGVTLVSGTEYWIGLVNSGNGARISVPSVSGGMRWGPTHTAGVPDNPFDTSPSSQNRRDPMLAYVSNPDATASGAIGTENETAPTGTVKDDSEGSGSVGTETETAPSGQGQQSSSGQGDVGTENETAPTGEGGIGQTAGGSLSTETETAPTSEAIGSDSVIRTTQTVLKTVQDDVASALTTQTVLKVLFTESPQTGPSTDVAISTCIIQSIVPSVDGSLEVVFPSPWPAPSP